MKRPVPGSARPWLLTAAICGLFTLLVLGALLANLGPLRVGDPLRSGALAQLKAELALRPGDEALKTAIRAYDAELRSAWFGRVALAGDGAWLLLAGAVATLAALLQAQRRTRQPFDPRAVPPPDPVRAQVPARWGLVAGGAVLAGGLLALGAGQVAAPSPEPPPPPLPPPDPAEMIANWPGFRGARAGLAAGTAPTAWDEATGIRWRAELPLPGVSSPAAWGDAVYVTGSDGRTQEVTAFAVADGAKRWSCRIPLPPGTAVEPFSDTGHAAPSPATDGRRVVALFASGVLAAVATDGRLLWSRALGVPESEYGLAASPALWRDRVLVQLDQGAADAGRSCLMAVELASGRTLWRTARPVGSSWSSPLVAEVAGRWQVITCADPWVIAYAPEDGRELWRAEALHGEIAPSPAVAGDLVFVANAGACLAAIRADGTGEVLWRYEEDLPDIASPVAAAGLVAMVGTDGTVTCLDALTGQRWWSHPGTAAGKASPLLIDGRLYVTDETGSTRIFAWERTLRLLATAPLGAPVPATPAVLGGTLYLRAERQLFACGAP